jgi:2-hydroxychromene-2-carboxylate isomerase
MKTIEIWFDFSSPYTYLLSETIEPVAARYGRTIDWRPTLLGAVFKVSGGMPLTDVPMKGEYSKRDFVRSARYYGLPFRMPSVFPIGTIGAARAVTWLRQTAPAKVAPFVHAALRAHFVDDRNISDAAVLAELARGADIDAEAMAQAVGTQAIKDALKTSVDESIARGVFGSPFVFIDDEPFWGHDRLPQIERWLAQGSF